ncbi:hypothetical protein L0337_44970 [candidate division KSB1 bacterium]|nr:hypothetical protein [candidate division KSB1 bacterium]
MPLPFPKLREKCETHVCLVDNRYGDERWEDVFEISRDEKDRQCREERAALETLYHQETEKARLNSLGGYIGTIKMNTKRFGVERRKCAIDSRGIFVAMEPAMQRIITSFRPILDPSQPPQNHGQFKREALTYYRRYIEKPWGQ